VLVAVPAGGGVGRGARGRVAERSSGRRDPPTSHGGVEGGGVGGCASTQTLPEPGRAGRAGRDGGVWKGVARRPRRDSVHCAWGGGGPPRPPPSPWGGGGGGRRRRCSGLAPHSKRARACRSATQHGRRLLRATFSTASVVAVRCRPAPRTQPDTLFTRGTSPYRLACGRDATRGRGWLRLKRVLNSQWQCRSFAHILVASSPRSPAQGSCNSRAESSAYRATDGHWLAARALIHRSFFLRAIMARRRRSLLQAVMCMASFALVAPTRSLGRPARVAQPASPHCGGCSAKVKGVGGASTWACWERRTRLCSSSCSRAPSDSDALTYGP